MNKAAVYKLTTDMKPYVYEALLATQGDRCNACGDTFDAYDIDHLRYAPDITIKDLQLLCYDCHKDKTMIANDHWLSGVRHCSTCTC